MSTIEQTRAVEGESVTYSLEIEGESLIELLEGAITHSDKGKSALRALNSVQLESVSGYLVARATDRYRLIEGRIELESGDLNTSLLSFDDVKRVIALAKEGKISNKVTLNRIGDLLTVSVNGSSITLTILDATYPPSFDYLLDQPFNPSGSDLGVTDTVSFSPALFADYAKIAGKGKPVTITFTGKNKLMLIGLVGNKVEWRAALMPMRIV